MGHSIPLKRIRSPGLSALRGLVLAGGLAALSVRASADATYNYNLQANSSLHVTVAYDMYQDWNNQLTHVTLNAAAGTFTATSGTNSFDSYCVDLDHYNVANTIATSYNIAGGAAPNGFPTPANPANYWSRLQKISWLYNTYAGTVANPTGGYTRDQTGAALQLAMWNVLQDDGTAFQSAIATDGGAGHFSVVLPSQTDPTYNTLNGAVSLSDTYLTQLYQSNTHVGNATLLYVNRGAMAPPGYHQNGGGQNMIGPPTGGGGGGGGAVPEGYSLSLLCCGLLPLAGVARWRRKTN
jgi:hypothetical protein